MNSLELIKSLIEKVQEYEQDAINKDALTVSEFMQYLKDDVSIDDYKHSIIQAKTYEHSNQFRENNIERVISQHILYMYRYIKFYSKHVFVHSRIKTIEEFGMLITVMQYQSLSKSDLIKKNVMEKSSGIEIINRLIKMQLFEQINNPDDQRSQLIRLTDLGKMELFSVFEKMDQLGKIATGDLNQREKMHLAQLLKKLDLFHADNYGKKGMNSLEDYLQKL